MKVTKIFKKRKVFVLVLQKKIMNSKALHLAEEMDGSHWRMINTEEGQSSRCKILNKNQRYDQMTRE